MEKNIKFSVVDTERKYVYDPAEDVYGGGEGVVSWGRENDIPKLMANCYERSATLKAAIDQTINYVMGDEIVINDEAGKWKEVVNRRGMDMRDLLEHIINDYYVYGNFAIQIIYNKLGNPVELYPLDVAKCRLNRDRNKVIYNKKGWTKWSTAGERYDRWGFAELNPDNPTMIYFYNGNGVRRVYNVSPWMAALDDVLTEIEGSRYSLNSVTNGFTARYIINIPDTANLTDEQKQIIEDGIRNKFCGYDAPSNFMIYYANDESKSLIVNKIEANEDPEHFQVVRDGAKANIFTAMRMSPLLVGVSDGKQGFATQEFSDSFKLFNRTVVQPVQDLFMRVIDDIVAVDDAIEIKPFTISFE
jgi:capsid portal protein